MILYTYERHNNKYSYRHYAYDAQFRTLLYSKPLEETFKYNASDGFRSLAKALPYSAFTACMLAIGFGFYYNNELTTDRYIIAGALALLAILGTRIMVAVSLASDREQIVTVNRDNPHVESAFQDLLNGKITVHEFECKRSRL